MAENQVQQLDCAFSGEKREISEPAYSRGPFAVQPGCTNLELRTLLHPRNNADHDGRIGSG